MLVVPEWGTNRLVVTSMPARHPRGHVWKPLDWAEGCTQLPENGRPGNGQFLASRGLRSAGFRRRRSANDGIRLRTSRGSRRQRLRLWQSWQVEKTSLLEWAA